MKNNSNGKRIINLNFVSDRVATRSELTSIKRANYSENLAKYIFWDFNGNLKIIIFYEQLLAVISKLGFYFIDDETGFIFVKNNIIYKVKSVEIFDRLTEFIGNFDDGEFSFDGEKSLIYNYINKHKKDLADPIRLRDLRTFYPFKDFYQSELKSDNVTEYFAYLNGVVKVTSEGVDFIDYKDLNQLGKYVFAEKIIQRNFTPIEPHTITQNNEFYEFLTKITSDETDETDENEWDVNEKRLKSLVTAIGYLLSFYKKKSNSKAVIIYDEDAEGNTEQKGRTGKSLIGYAIEQIKKAITIAGDRLKSDDKFLFGGVKEDTGIVIIQEGERKFNFEALKSLITDAFVVEQKYKMPVVIPFHYSPKILITSNRVFTNDDRSIKERKFEIGLTDYFAKTGKKPNEYFGHDLFDDWDETQWTKFDNFAMRCVQFYLMNGLIEFQSEKLQLRKIQASIKEEFIEVFDEILANKPNKVTNSELKEWAKRKITDPKEIDKAPKLFKKYLTFMNIEHNYTTARINNSKTAKVFTIYYNN